MKKLNMVISALCMVAGITQNVSAQLQNFNEPNTEKLISAIQNKSLHVVQLGDSHTAADEMTDAMRNQLQAHLGNGGLGWAMPMYFSGQRMALYGYDNSGWQQLSSRSQREHNYTLGGFIAKPNNNGATLTLKAKRFAAPQQFTVNIRQSEGDADLTGIDARGQSFTLSAPIKDNTWQTTKIMAQLPFTITAHHANNTAIGGWWGENSAGRGAIVSALGINGAELSFWDRWNSRSIDQSFNSIKPELVILAYGTNEAFNANVDVSQVRQLLVEKIRQIRRATPDTAVMIVSAPETLKQTAGQCGTRPIKLSEIQQAQLSVAQTEKTLFWDWQAETGGSCSMKSWMNQSLARPDGIHFSVNGYHKLGRSLANDILKISGITPMTSPVQQQSDYESIKIIESYRHNTGYGEICNADKTNCMYDGTRKR